MRVFILIIILVSLQNAAKAESETITHSATSFNDTISTINGITGYTDIEKKTLKAATVKQAMKYDDCIAELSSDTNEVIRADESSCINEVFGDIYN